VRKNMVACTVERLAGTGTLALLISHLAITPVSQRVSFFALATSRQ